MQKVNSPVVSVSLNSYQQLSDVNEQTGLSNNYTDAYLQNEELSSIGEGFQQIGGTSLQIDLSKFPDGTQILQAGPPLIIDIPDSYIEAFRNSQLGTDRQLSYEHVAEDLLIYRKEQSDFLIGKLKRDHT